ncbi:hypothetical protein [Veillonella sp.]|uniref:hypothetical protein n=1 Tax=Veillonella sp. TaxID=1926307 RepID=UPI001CAF9893|nr:hypothetical protein [Veillonella sp.]MBF1759251.1 hypothetical protein [Veillonella sp.]
MVACKLSIKKIFDRIERDDKFEEFKITCGLTPSDEMDSTKFAANFYKSPVVNYKGKVTGSKDLYSEVIAETLINDNFIKDWLNLMPERPEHFKINHPNTDKNVDALKITNRKEEILAKLLFYQGNVDGLGYIFDYQTPLKKTRNDSYGKIDLLGYNTDDECYSVIELKYRPSGSEETLLRCILEAYTYYKLLDINQIKSAVGHDGIQKLKELSGYKHTNESELVVLFDEKSCAKDDGGAETNLMLRIVSNEPDDPNNYPSKTVVSQQYKECQELINPSKRKELRALCEAILKQESKLKQIRFVVLRADTDSKSSYPTNIKGWSRKLDRLYRAETLLTIPRKG